MPVTVKTCASPAEAAAALSSDRGARFIAGGTLVMRALNEGDVDISTLVRLGDRALARIEARGARMALGAGVTLAQILRERDLAFLHPVVRSIGGPAIRTTATVGGNLFAASPFGDLAVALLALDAVRLGPGRLWRARHAARGISFRSRPQCRASSCSASPSSVRSHRTFSAGARRPASSRRALRSCRSPRMSRTWAAGSRTPASPMARWRRPRSGPRPSSARSRPIARRAGVAAAIAAAAEGTSPVNDPIASAWYRREVVGVHLRRLLLGQGLRNEPWR